MAMSALWTWKIISACAPTLRDSYDMKRRDNKFHALDLKFAQKKKKPKKKKKEESPLAAYSALSGT